MVATLRRLVMTLHTYYANRSKYPFLYMIPELSGFPSPLMIKGAASHS